MDPLVKSEMDVFQLVLLVKLKTDKRKPTQGLYFLDYKAHLIVLSG